MTTGGRATAGLRAELRRQLLSADVHEMPLWKTFVVKGPYEFADLSGRTSARIPGVGAEQATYGRDDICGAEADPARH